MADPVTLGGTPIAGLAGNPVGPGTPPGGQPSPPPPPSPPPTPQSDPFDPRRLNQGRETAPPVSLDNALKETPPAIQPPAGPPPGPGLSPATSVPEATNFNSFINQMIGFAQTAGMPGSNLNPMRREHQAQVLREQAEREGEEVSEEQRDLARRMREHSESEWRALKPLFEDQSIRVARAEAEMAEARRGIPKYNPPPAIDATSAQGFLMATLAAALIGGIAGKAGWMRVTEYFNGSVQGLIDGNHQLAEQYNTAWKNEYEAAMAQWRATQENMRDILFATDMPINHILKMAEVQAHIDGADEKAILAREGHIDKLRKAAEDEEKMSDALDMKKATIQQQIDSAILRNRMMGSAGGNNLDQYGLWAVGVITAGGNMRLLNALTTRWASPQRAILWNMLAKDWYEQGVNPAVFNEREIGLQVEKKAQMWSKVRYEGMSRLQVSLQLMEEPLKEAILEANKLHPRAYNQPINALLKDFGTGPQTARIAYVNTIAYMVGNEYVQLSSMPVSGAQMHATSLDTAKRMVSGAASLAEIKGFYEGVKLDTINSRKALDFAVQESIHDVERMGVEVNDPTIFGLPKQPTPKTPAEAEHQYAPNAADYAQPPQ